MFARLARKSVQSPYTRNFATRKPGGRRRGRGNNNNNNNNNNKQNKLVRGPDYEEPSAGAKTSMVYLLAGVLGASATVTGYLFFVYNPGVGDRRYGRQREENDAYFNSQDNDNYQQGDWDDQTNQGDDDDPGMYGSYEEERGGDIDPYAQQKRQRTRNQSNSNERWT